MDLHQGEYEELSDFYREKVFSQFPILSGICFDVLDAMNATQVLGRDKKIHIINYFRGSGEVSIFDVVEGWEATFLFWQQFSASFFLPWSSISLQGEMVELILRLNGCSRQFL